MHASHAHAHMYTHTHVEDEELSHVIKTIAAELKASTLHAQLLKAAQEEVSYLVRKASGRTMLSTPLKTHTFINCSCISINRQSCVVHHYFYCTIKLRFVLKKIKVFVGFCRW